METKQEVTFNLTLSEKEANSLVALLDTALKANGLKAADAVYFTQKIQVAAQGTQVQETKVEDTTK